MVNLAFGFMYYLIIVLTIFIASRADLMYDNISYVASLPHYRIMVVAYTFICSLFFAFKMYQIYKKFHYIYKFCIPLIIIAAFSMAIGSLFTYGASPLYSNIHVYTSIISCIIFLFLLCIYMYFLSIDYVNIYLKCHHYFYFSINILLVLIVVMGRINGIIEIVYICIVSLTLAYMDKQLC